jgi:phosphoglucosamine mutase
VLLGVMRDTGLSLASLSECLRKYPQILVNVPVRSKPPFETVPGLPERVQAFEAEMNGSGRILIRYSGTEALARVMIEGADGDRIRIMATELADMIRAQIGAA